MVIRSSSARDIAKLLAELRDGSPVEREAAIARLRVIGPRAIDRLAALVGSGAPEVARVAALRALEGMADPRARDAAVAAIHDRSPAVAAAAVAACRPWLSAETTVLDALTGLALDRDRHPSARMAALDALSELPRPIVEPILQRLDDEDPVLAARAAGHAAPPSFDQPDGIREWLRVRGGDAPLSEIHQAIAGMRDRERDEPSANRRQQWQAARGAAHAALGQRGSRVALYDLRETFDAARAPLPLDFLHAATLVGDVTCLEPLGRAWTAAGKELWWRDRLAESARAIVVRENLTARHAAVKRVKARFPGFL